MNNLTAKLYIMLKQIVICCLFFCTINNTLATPLPELPKKITPEPTLINNSDHNTKKDKSFWQWFKGSLGFESEEDDKSSETVTSTVEEVKQEDIPAIPSIKQIATANNSTNTINNNEVSTRTAAKKIPSEAPGKGQTLLDQDFNIGKDQNIDELFAEFAEDALVAIEDNDSNISNANIERSQTKNIPLVNETSNTLEQTPLTTKDNSRNTENNSDDNLRIPNFEKLLSTEQDNNKLNEIESKINTANNTSKAQDKPSIDNLPDIPPVSTPRNNTLSNNDTSNDIVESATNSNQKQEPKNRITSFREQIKRKLAGSSQAPQLTPKQLNSTNRNDDSLLSQSIGNAQLLFVNNEAKVLTLPNDDVVLGKLTEEAKIESMDFLQYTNLFWENYERVKSEGAHKSLENFINNYNENFNTERFLYSEESDYTILESAINAIEYDRYNDLKTLLDQYDILQLDSISGNNMLHYAAQEGNFPAAKLLLIRGIDMRAKNHHGESAMTIAKRYNHQHIVYLLKEAGYR